MRIITLFQFTPLREGRRLTPDEMGELTDYFNSRPSARGDVLVHHNPTKLIISIHAPPRGATRRYCTATKRKSISIHAPPRGATHVGIPTRVSNSFQFTPLREGRHRTACARRQCCYFNSRPSARGDARAGTMQRERQQRFQFTPLREGRRACWLAADGANISIHAPPRGATDDVMNALKPILFQFTPLREGRPSAPATKKTRWRNFNSRPSARGDYPELR